MSESAFESEFKTQKVIKHPKNEVSVFSLAEWKESCCDETYQRLKTVMGNEFMTLDEITEKYSNKFGTKSKPSINRYLKDYEDKRLIHVAGRIKKADSTNSEKLYTISSYIEYIDNLYATAWQDKDRGIELAKKIIVLMQNKFGSGFDTKSLYELFYNYEVFKKDRSIDILENVVKQSLSNSKQANKILESINSLKNDEIIIFYTNLKFISWFLFDRNLEDFINSINKSKTTSLIDIKNYKKWEKEKKFASVSIEKDENYTYIPNESFKREPIYFTHYQNWLDYILDMKYNAVLQILQRNNHPLSISEIYKKSSVAIQVIKDKFICTTKEAEKLKTKIDDFLKDAPIDLEEMEVDKNGNQRLKYEVVSESSIYRILQDLKKSGLVVEDGVRAKNNSPKDQIVYTTPGMSIIYFEDSDKFWEQEETWKKVSKLISEILEFTFNKKLSDKAAFHNLFTTIEKDRFEAFKNSLLEPHSQEIVNYFHYRLNTTELNALMDMVGTVFYTFASDKLVVQYKNDLLNNFN